VASKKKRPALRLGSGSRRPIRAESSRQATIVSYATAGITRRPRRFRVSIAPAPSESRFFTGVAHPAASACRWWMRAAPNRWTEYHHHSGAASRCRVLGRKNSLQSSIAKDWRISRIAPGDYRFRVIAWRGRSGSSRGSGLNRRLARPTWKKKFRSRCCSTRRPAVGTAADLHHHADQAEGGHAAG